MQHPTILLADEIVLKDYVTAMISWICLRSTKTNLTAIMVHHDMQLH